MQYKLLTQEDYLNCRNMLDTIHPEADIIYPRPSALVLTNYYFDNTESMYKVFGVYDTYGILNACVFTVFYDYDRSWHIRYVIRQPFATLDAIVNTVNFALLYAEQGNYYRWHIKSFSKSHLAYERILRTSNVFTRYNIATEEIIPAYKKSSFSKYWNMFQGNIIYPKPIIIREYSLQNKYRKFDEQ